MAQIRLKGILPGSDLGMVGATIDGVTRSAAITAFQNPAPVSLPCISNGLDTDTLTLQTIGLTGISAYLWRIVGGPAQGTGAALSGAGLGGQWIECEVTCDQGTLISPPVMVYATTMMSGMPMDPGHLVDDRAVLNLVPHADVTHIAIADGNWSAAETWRGGEVPRAGAVVLIPHGRIVTYDSAEKWRLDRVRVDGTLAWALDRSTYMLVETLIGTRGSSVILGTAQNNLPAQFSARISFSGRDHSAGSLSHTDMRADTFLGVRGWGRGFVSHGLVRIWGVEKTPWFDADPIDAGATSLTARKDIVGLEVGDTIVIGGTDADYVNVSNADHAMDFQDEERVVTAVSGRTVSWSAGLTYPHKNQLPGSTRTDLYPAVLVKNNKNIRFESEATFPNWRRGHFAVMHHHAEVDIWRADFVNMGRTDKSINDVVGDAGIIDPNGNFKRRNSQAVSNKTQAVPLTPAANLQSRYPVHIHMVGFDHMGTRPIVSNCGIVGSPGWGFVHHDCDMDFFNCTGLDIFGCGMVSESGSEVGAWADNLMMRTSYVAQYRTGQGYATDLRSEPKNLEANKGALGDTFSHGYAYGFRGRGMRTNRNKAVSCTYANVFWHRSTDDSSRTAGVKNLLRSKIDLKEITLPQKPELIAPAQLDYIDYPIIHHSDNEAVACMSGLFVTKNVHTQFHDANIRLKNMKTWGYRLHGATVEYVGVYIIDGFDAVCGKKAHEAGEGTGWRFGANNHTVISRNLRAEGNARAVSGNGFDSTGNHGAYSLADPRWGLVGLDDVDNTSRLFFPGVPPTASLAETLFQDDDWYDDYDYHQDPSENYPLELGSFFSFNFNDIVPLATNADGSKTDNISALAKLASKPGTDTLFPSSGARALEWRVQRGFWEYNGNRVIVMPLIISDRLTGRPAKITKMYRYTNGGATSGNNGTYVYASTPCVQSDMTAVVAIDGSVTVDLLAGATGAGGPGTYMIDEEHISPQNGTIAFDFGTGTITYKPDDGFSGTDEAYFFVKSQGRYATVRLDFLVGAQGAVVAPASPVHFTVTDHAQTGTIGVMLGTPPDAGGRKIIRTEYSTDAGATWRRLCHKWVQAVHKVTVGSDGTAIASGDYNLRLRYKTDFDYSTSAVSADAAVTIA